MRVDPVRIPSPGRERAATAAADRDPLPKAVAHRDAIYRAATAHGVDPLLLASFAAQETGAPGSVANRNVPLGADGHGHGMFQIDDRYHPIARSAAILDPAVSAGYAARMVREGLDAAGRAGLAGTAAVRGAANYYHAGSIGKRDAPNTQWPDVKLRYDDSVVRHLDQMRAEGSR